MENKGVIWHDLANGTNLQQMAREKKASRRYDEYKRTEYEARYNMVEVLRGKQKYSYKLVIDTLMEREYNYAQMKKFKFIEPIIGYWMWIHSY